MIIDYKYEFNCKILNIESILSNKMLTNTFRMVKSQIIYECISYSLKQRRVLDTPLNFS